QRLQWNHAWWQYWTTSGLLLDQAYAMNVHITLKNNWGVHGGGAIGGLGATYDDRSARGGPAIRQDRWVAPWFVITGDDRRAVVPYFFFNGYNAGNGKSRTWNVSPEIDYKMFRRFSGSMALNYGRN